MYKKIIFLLCPLALCYMHTNETYPSGSLQDRLVKCNREHEKRMEELRPYFGMKGYTAESQEFLRLREAICRNEDTIMKINTAPAPYWMCKEKKTPKTPTETSEEPIARFQYFGEYQIIGSRNFLR